MTGLPETMRGVQLTGHGGPDKLRLRDDIPVPRPGPGQVLVRVAAAGVNNTDINTRLGWYSADVTGATDAVADDAGIAAGGWGGALNFPRIQGADLCGTIVAAGPATGRLSPGARVTCPVNLPRETADNPVGFIVLGSEIDGAFAEFCLMDEADLYDVSSSPLSDIEIAAMPCAYGTAEALLERAGVGAGDRVLITGASGGVGMAAVHLARLRGAEITGVAAAAKADAVRQAGAVAVLARDQVPPEASQTHVIDVVGGPAWPALIRALKPGGTLALAGAIAGPVVAADLRDIYLRDITICGSTYQPPAVFARLVGLINDGALRPLVSGTYPLAGIAAAQADFTAKRFPGKLVLIP